MTQKFIDVQEDIQRFIDEARSCAKAQLGFASLLTIFPVILAISEAFLKGKPTIDILMEGFINKMSDNHSWIFHQGSEANLGSESIKKFLSDIRNGLTHQLSLPIDVWLTNNNEEAKKLSSAKLDLYIISTTGFIDAVETTVETIIRQYPEQIFDALPLSVERRTANRIEPARNEGIVSSAVPEIQVTKVGTHIQ